MTSHDFYYSDSRNVSCFCDNEEFRKFLLAILKPEKLRQAIKMASTEIEEIIFGLNNTASTDPTIDQKCLMDIPTEIMTWLQHFNAIFLHGFTVNYGHGISGPLYANEQWVANGYSINVNGTVDCSPEDYMDIKDVGLVIESPAELPINISVNGNIFLPPESFFVGLTEITDGCAIFSDGIYGPIPFSNIIAAIDIIERATDPDPRFDKLLFGPCLYKACTPANDLQSDANGILFGGSSWNGPVNRAYPNDTIIIFSIPVWDTGAVFIDTDYATAGLQPCRAIFHFYAVTGNITDPASATYTSSSNYTISRNTTGMFAGSTFAPAAEIEDGTIGNFAGQIVADRYRWSSPASGVNILNYADTGDSCQGNFACYPPSNYTRTLTTLTTSATRTVTVSDASSTTTTTLETSTITESVPPTVVIAGTVTIPTYIIEQDTIVATETVEVDTTTTTIIIASTATEISTVIIDSIAQVIIPQVSTEYISSVTYRTDVQTEIISQTDTYYLPITITTVVTETTTLPATVYATSTVTETVTSSRIVEPFTFTLPTSENPSASFSLSSSSSSYFVSSSDEPSTTTSTTTVIETVYIASCTKKGDHYHDGQKTQARFHVTPLWS
ncbi:MAG: hypothetical protein EXX96DRAFT_541368 [Benjaminiella poitrasii]|nr:MAG: hypothetical protein EXX96DRAFT_541368 [Benjaminiella poitrasii]